MWGDGMVGIIKRSGGRKLTIGVSTMPHRKMLCLVVEEGNTLTKYATFNNEEAAYAFMDLFCDFMGVERIEWFGREEGGK
jgi:hypothetical protein